jgi:hypothetical protein
MTRAHKDLGEHEKKCVQRLARGDSYDGGWKFATWSRLTEPERENYRRHLKRAAADAALGPRKDGRKEEDIVFDKVLERYRPGAQPPAVELKEPPANAQMARRGAEIKRAEDLPPEAYLGAGFLRDLATGDILGENGQRVALPGGIRIQGFAVDDHVDLTNLEAGAVGMDLRDCWLPGGLALDASQIAKLCLVDCTVRNISAFATQIGGLVYMRGVHVRESLNFGGAVISGPFDLIGGGVDGEFVLVSAVVRGSLRMSFDEMEPVTAEDRRPPPLVIGSLLRLDEARIEGELSFRNVEIRGDEATAVYARGSYFNGISATGEENPNWEPLTGGGGVGYSKGQWLPGLVTQAAVAMVSTRIGISGCKLEGADLNAATGFTPWNGIAFWMRDCVIEGPLRLTTANSVTPTDALPTINGLVSVQNSIIDGDVELWGARFEARPCNAAQDDEIDCDAAIRFEGVHIMHDLHFDHPPSHVAIDKAKTPSRVTGAALVRSCRIDGDVIIGRASWNVGDAGHIGLSLKNTAIAGDLCIEKPPRDMKRIGTANFSGCSLRTFEDGRRGEAWGDVKLKLDGCNYQRFDDTGGRLSWLQRQRRRDRTSESYHVAAKALHAAGQYNQAHDILSHAMTIEQVRRPLAWPGILFWGGLFDYGYGALRAGLLVLAFWLFGGWATERLIDASVLTSSERQQLVVAQPTDSAALGEASAAEPRSGGAERSPQLAHARCNVDPLAYAADAMLIGIDLGPEERCQVDARFEWLKTVYGLISTLWLVLTTLTFNRVLRRQL